MLLRKHYICLSVDRLSGTIYGVLDFERGKRDFGHRRHEFLGRRAEGQMFGSFVESKIVFS